MHARSTHVCGYGMSCAGGCSSRPSQLSGLPVGLRLGFAERLWFADEGVELMALPPSALSAPSALFAFASALASAVGGEGARSVPLDASHLLERRLHRKVRHQLRDVKAVWVPRDDVRRGRRRRVVLGAPLAAACGAVLGVAT